MSRKLSMSYVDLIAWLAENRKRLEGCRIDNIFSTAKTGLFIFVIHCANGDQQLIIEPGKRVHFTRFNRERQLNSKAKMLRELIRGQLIKSVNLIEGERILKFQLSNSLLYVELLPKGILVVTDEEGKIKFVTEERRFKDRTMRPGEVYVLPPTQTPLKDEEIASLLKKGSLSRILGIPQEFVNVLGLRADSMNQLTVIKEKLREIMNNIEQGKIHPCLIPEQTFWPVQFPGCVQRSNYDEVLDEYFTNLEKTDLSNAVDEGEVKKLDATISKLLETLDETRREAETLRQKGRLIMENYTLVENKLKENSKEIEINGVKLDLDPKISITKNATIYFEKAKELENKIKRTQEAIKELEMRRDELLSKTKAEVEASKLIIRKKEWYEKYHWSFTTNGYLVIAGRDIDQNESLVKKMLEDKDIFLHADIQGAPSTIIKNPEGIQEKDIIDAALIAASYSKAWKIGLGSVDVFWVYGEQVSKSPPAGEYLPKGSFMIYGKKNYIKNVKLELGLGVNTEEGVRIEVGPPDVISRRCRPYVVLVPGDTELEKLSDRISKIFARSIGVHTLKVLKDEIIRMIPGKSKLKSTSEHQSQDNAI
ncbi:Rqc2 family fibronectin-binding protein [Metallosphaera hakonensis]|uniref:Rqc2 family fibronectin-binding protein n=1 Tax=Metallosphaera hakonensis TaxID=79601 RepID=UPI001F0DE1EA|nr:NFACT family protein [Metallosphaera hakonensis]